ncbi:MAG: VOC family protein [Desulfuromonadia bacterium]
MKPKETILSIQLAVSNIAASAAFYGGILDLPLQHALTANGAPEHFVIRSGSMEIVFVEDEGVLREHPALAERLSLYPRGVGVTLHFTVTNIEEIADALNEEGLDIFYPLTIHPFGIKELWCHDPDGYLVVLEEPVSR